MSVNQVPAKNSAELSQVYNTVFFCPDDLYLPDKVWRLDIPDSENYVPEFVYYSLRLPSSRRYFEGSASGAAGVKNISKSKAANVPLEIPSIQRQQAAVRCAGSVSRQLKKGTQLENTALEIQASLQSRAFRGEL